MLNVKTPAVQKSISKRTSKISAIATLSLVGFLGLPGIAQANNTAQNSIQAFYSFLSNPGSASHASEFKAATSENWESIGNYSGKIKTRDQLIGQLGKFDKLIPDLNWEIVEVIESENRIVVRGRATGTPVGPFFGVDGKGKSFDIMSIDIHTLDKGKITRSYHIEDWAGALSQLKAK